MCGTWNLARFGQNLFHHLQSFISHVHLCNDGMQLHGSYWDLSLLLLMFSDAQRDASHTHIHYIYSVRAPFRRLYSITFHGIETVSMCEWVYSTDFGQTKTDNSIFEIGRRQNSTQLNSTDPNVRRRRHTFDFYTENFRKEKSFVMGDNATI